VPAREEQHINIKSGSHAIGPSNGKLLIKTHKDGMGAKLAHDLVLAATKWHGTLNVDADNPGASSANLTVDARSIEIVEASGGVKGLSDKDRKDIAKNIDDKVLQTSKFPELTFESTSVSGSEPSFHVAGNMTVVGTTRPVNVNLNVNGSQVTATTAISQKDFGIKPFSAMFGAIKLRDDVEFELTLDLPSA
jgi:polyisoprenoid-binding protein YceI